MPHANKTALEKSKAEAKDALARIKAEEKARKKVEEASTACQEEKKYLQEELDHQRQLHSQVEHKLVEAQQAIHDEPRSRMHLLLRLLMIVRRYSS